MKKTIMKAAILAAVFAFTQQNAQSQNWLTAGNGGSASQFLGTTAGTGVNFDLRFKTNNAQRMVIKQNGRVGIGITSPSCRLHVQGANAVNDTIVIKAISKNAGLTVDHPTIYGESVSTPGFGVGVQGTGNFIGVFGNGGSYGVLGNGGSTGVYGEAAGSPGDTTTATGAIADGVDAIGGPGNQSTGLYAQAGGGQFNYGVIGFCGPAYAPSDSDDTHRNWAAYFFGDIVYSRAFRWSDAKLKNNIQPVASALEKLNQVQTSTYTFKRSEFPQLELPSGNQIGFIAENLEKVFPELVTITRSPKIVSGRNGGKISRESVTYKSVDYEGMIPVTIAAIKEQQQQLNAKDAQIAELSSKIAAIESRLAALENTASAKLSSVSANESALEQNNPNPFNQSTEIRFSVPKNYSSAQIIITSVDGKSARTYSINGTGVGSITVNANELAAGTYTYSLNVDGKVIDTKSLVLTK